MSGRAHTSPPHRVRLGLAAAAGALVVLFAVAALAEVAAVVWLLANPVRLPLGGADVAGLAGTLPPLSCLAVGGVGALGASVLLLVLAGTWAAADAPVPPADAETPAGTLLRHCPTR
jgi:hypothetical protein